MFQPYHDVLVRDAFIGFVLAATATGCSSQRSTAPTVPGRPQASAALAPTSLGPPEGLYLLPKAILFIRHGDKDPYDPTNPHLDKRGQARANALPDYFANDPNIRQFGTPDWLGCMAKKNPTKSVRGIETCQPLADATGEPINGFGARHWQAALNAGLNDPTSDGGTILYVWHHDEIVMMAHALGCTNAPAKWDKGAYDRTWTITLDDQGNPVTFNDFPQNILPGDSTNTYPAIPCTGDVGTGTAPAGSTSSS